MKRGDVYFVSLAPTSGHEQQGMRPVVVLSPASFNRLNRLALVAPITNGGSFARNAGFAVSLESLGTKTTGVVLCNQLRSLDVEARGGRYVESLPEELVGDILARTRTLLE